MGGAQVRGIIRGTWTAGDTVDRALHAVRYDRDIDYALGGGGANPDADRCDVDAKGVPTFRSDCVGFGMHCAGADRYQPIRFPLYGGWINCNSAILDARSARPSMFREIPRWGALPGDMVVYPSRFFGLGHGHWGVVVGLTRFVGSLDPKATWTDRLVVAHCSAGHQKRLGYAISQGSEEIFTKRATVLRPLWYREEA